MNIFCVLSTKARRDEDGDFEDRIWKFCGQNTKKLVYLFVPNQFSSNINLGNKVLP